MAEQKHTLRLVAKLDTSDVQRELAKLNGRSGGAYYSGSRPVGGAYPPGSQRGENSLALAANKLAGSFDRLQGGFGKLEKDLGSVNDRVAGFNESLKSMTRAVDAAKRAAERSTKSASSVSHERFSERYMTALKSSPERRSRIVQDYFTLLETEAGSRRGSIARAKALQGLAIQALAGQHVSPREAYGFYTAAGVMGALQRNPDSNNVVGASFGKFSVYNPKYLKPGNPLFHMRPGFSAMPNLFGGFGAVFSPENDLRNYQFVDQSNPEAMARRAEELRRAGGSARRWAAMFVAQAAFSGGQRLASAYGATGLSRGLGVLGSVASGAISGGAIGGMFGLGAGAVPGAIIGGALGLGTGVVNLVAGNIEEGRANEEAVRAMRQRMGNAFELQKLATLTPYAAEMALNDRKNRLEKSKAVLEGWNKEDDAKGYQAEMERYQGLQQEIAILRQVTDAEKARVKALEDAKKALDEMKTGRAWRLEASGFAKSRDLAALNRLLGTEEGGMNGATDAAGFAFHANRVDQLKAMIAGIEAEFKAMSELRGGRVFAGRLGDLVKGGDFDTLTGLVKQFEELARNAQGLKELSDALSKLTSVEVARGRVQAFRDMKANWEWGRWVWGLGKDKDLSMLQSIYGDEWLKRHNATNIEDWNLANTRIGVLQTTASKIVDDMVKGLESQMPRFDASLTTSLAQFGIGMNEAHDNVSRQMQVWEEQTEIQKQIKDLLEKNAWTSEYS